MLRTLKELREFVLAYTLLIPMLFIKTRSFTIDDLVSFVFSFPIRLVIAPIQMREEIAELLKVAARRRLRIILEIGTANGGTLFLFAKVAEPQSTIISIDLPEGSFGGGYSSWRIPLYRSFSRSQKTRMHLVRANSHNLQTLAEVKRILDGRPVDLLLIDGDHTYEGVRKDFEMYSPLVGNGSIIAFHDIVPGPQENVGGVPEFWQEIRRTVTSVEIVWSWNQRGYGIGVIYTSHAIIVTCVFHHTHILTIMCFIILSFANNRSD